MVGQASCLSCSALLLSIWPTGTNFIVKSYRSESGVRLTMSEKEYIIPYSYDARKRHYHKASKGIAL